MLTEFATLYIFIAIKYGVLTVYSMLINLLKKLSFGGYYEVYERKNKASTYNVHGDCISFY